MKDKLQEHVSKNITWHEGKLAPEARRDFFKHRALTVWMTGLSGAGKSTIAFELEKLLMDAGRMCFVLDGDNVRHGLSSDLGFSIEDRKENLRRISEVAKLFNDAGMIVITAFISPYAEDRVRAKEIIGADNFIEVYLSTTLAVCEQRDPKGLYAKARRGEISCFTGISDLYEAPKSPTVSIDTSECTPIILAKMIIEEILRWQ